MNDEYTMLIEADGTVRFIYSDDLAGTFAGEQQETRRASHVEPLGRAWTADMGPVGGPVLGPYPTRQAALDAEVDWLRKERGL